MQVMFEREQAVLSGAHEIDDAFLAGSKPVVRVEGVNKVPFIGGGETDLRGRPQIVRFDRVDNHGLHAIQRWGRPLEPARDFVLGDLVQCVMSGISPDTGRKEHPEFPLGQHAAIKQRPLLAGTFHAFEFPKYGHRYLAEFAWRFNRRSTCSAASPAACRCRSLLSQIASTIRSHFVAKQLTPVTAGYEPMRVQLHSKASGRGVQDM